MDHYFFIHSSVDGHLGCFHVLAIANSTAMNHGIHVYFSILVSSGYMPRIGITGSHGGFIPSFFLRNLHTIFHSGYITLHCGSPLPLVFISSQSFCSFMPSGDLYLSAFLVQKGPLAFSTPRLWKQSIINPNFFNSASVKARVKSICRSFQ